MRLARQNSQLKQAGFTIIELMVASLVFTVILGVITSGIVHFTADYYKGINSSATQTTARTIANLIAQNLEYGGGEDSFSTATNGYNKAICIGSIKINYILGSQLAKDPDTSVKYSVLLTPYDRTLGSCQTYDGITAGKELMGSNMRLTDLYVTPISNGNSTGGHLYRVNVGVAYGDSDLFCSTAVAPSNTYGGCDRAAPALQMPSESSAATNFWGTNENGSKITCHGVSGQQFCAISHLTTQVNTRF